MNRLVLGIIGVFVIMILLFLFVFRGGNEQEPGQPAVKVESLEKYADDDSQVKYVTRGRVNGDDVHRQIVISVSSGQRQIDIIQGYQGTIINRQTFDNNQEAYKEFLSALKIAGFTKKLENPTTVDRAGRCPTGQVYSYILESGASELSNLWSGSCSNKIGTSGGNDSLIKTLFQAQITDYSKITSGVSL